MNVSRETSEALEAYSALVLKWTKAINLVSARSKQHIWDRHIQDSLQIYDLIDLKARHVDLGSGGGFPGVVLAIAAKNAGSATEFTLIESDQRKCTFLRTVGRELDLNLTVHSKRIEDLPSVQAETVSARALADLDALLGYVHQHMTPGGTAVLPKGEKWKSELELALKSWSFEYEAVPSQTNSGSVILKIGNLQRA